ncbi:unnamed protein product [Gemmata massiliana]|uniref:Uncharacterized protein n=1 Tax=Gemmata massiliana TaxID=1210884 RepID=A0A6P2CS87_9BACT|nr:hypothetical protein [Gemmata massiliana]VTR90965.1 unnamed protein product [Gemmata massiliana]
MSIVRMGMSEDSKFGEGYDAIFGTKKSSTKKPGAKAAPAKKPGAKAAPAKKPAAKKK